MRQRGPSSLYWIPRWVMDRSWSLLRQDGLKGVESTLTWGGRKFGDEAVIMTIVYPCGPDVERRRGLVRVGPDTTAEMGRWLRDQNLSGLVQVHSHPGAWTGHSAVDDNYSIASSDGFLSIVWPNFAQRPVQQPTELGVHLLQGGRWVELTEREVRSTLRVVESEALVWAPGSDVPLQEEQDRS